jgi:hypothetical protein
LHFNEVHYDPIDSTELIEFIELYNAGSSVVNLSSWSIDKGVNFTFPAGGTLDPGGYLVVSEDPVPLQAKFGVSSLGPWNGRLDGEGEESRGL